jgi:hypothetical protein
MSEDNQYNLNFLQPLKAVVDYLIKDLPENKESKILEITRSSNIVFPLQSEKIDCFKLNNPDTLEALQASDVLDFVYVRHALENVESPQVVFDILTNLSQSGYIETTSPLVELSKSIETSIAHTHRGMYLTRYIIWTEKEDNSLHILPKYGVFDYFNVDPNFENNIRNVLLDSPVYWNNYYYWNPTNPPKVVYHSYGIDFDWETYGAMLGRAIHHNMEHTNSFMEKVKPFVAESTASTASTAIESKPVKKEIEPLETQTDEFEDPVKPKTANSLDMENTTSLS